MTSEADINYTIKKEEDRLIFSTQAYTDSPDSVLHSGIYNREFTSVLASAALAGIVYLLVAMNVNNALVRSLAFLLVFAGGFPLFRKFIFRESLMEVVFSNVTGKAVIFITWITKRQKEIISISSIKDIIIESVKREAENPDAVKFVEKISLQHGTVIPGFGKDPEIFLLKLRLSDGSERIILMGKSMQDTALAQGEIKEFLKI